MGATPREEFCSHTILDEARAAGARTNNSLPDVLQASLSLSIPITGSELRSSAPDSESLRTEQTQCAVCRGDMMISIREGFEVDARIRARQAPVCMRLARQIEKQEAEIMIRIIMTNEKMWAS